MHALDTLNLQRRSALAAALALLSRAVAAEPDSVVVWNPLAHNRTDIVTVHVETPLAGAKVTDADSVRRAARGAGAPSGRRSRTPCRGRAASGTRRNVRTGPWGSRRPAVGRNR